MRAMMRKPDWTMLGERRHEAETIPTTPMGREGRADRGIPAAEMVEWVSAFPQFRAAVAAAMVPTAAAAAEWAEGTVN